MVKEYRFPEKVYNIINGRESASEDGRWIDKYSPHSGEVLCRLARSTKRDVDNAVKAAEAARKNWAALPPVKRGEILYRVCEKLEDSSREMARFVALETGKSEDEALGETMGAVALGRFFAGEGQRLYGRTTTSGVQNKYAMTVRQPCGVAGLIVAANTPIANVAWKVFPALICGNGVVLKTAEDTPATAWLFSMIANEAGLVPAGILNVVQGLGHEAGAALVEHEGVDVVSFTGSAAVGRWIAGVAGKRLARVSLELGGKNPFVVCDDADIENAVKWASLSAFSNAGQRCASGSRLIVFSSVYDEFKKRLVNLANSLKLGPSNEDDLGPVINLRQLENMLGHVKDAVERGGRILCGGGRLKDSFHERGYYMAPTLIEGLSPKDPLSRTEIFGPVASLYKVSGFQEALELANDSDYGLTASIHTRSFDRAVKFCQDVRSGVAVVNAGTYGSEPHMPFGGVKNSGNGTREPGTEALDIYSDLKDIYMNINEENI